MTFSSILFVSNNLGEFQQIIAIVNDGKIFQEVSNLDDCFSRQKDYDTNSLTIVDAELIQNHDAIASITENIVGRIILIGHNWTEAEQIKAIASGVSGYCEKDITPGLFTRVVESVCNEEVWVPRHLIPKVINLLIAKNFKVEQLDNGSEQFLIQKEKFDGLSERERQVAMLIADGKSNRQIASKLFITERTVKAHLTNIFQKLKVNDRIQLVIFIKNLLDTR